MNVNSGMASSGARFLAARGAFAGLIWIGDDFEFTEGEIDGLLGSFDLRARHGYC